MRLGPRHRAGPSNYGEVKDQLELLTYPAVRGPSFGFVLGCSQRRINFLETHQRLFRSTRPLKKKKGRRRKRKRRQRKRRGRGRRRRRRRRRQRQRQGQGKEKECLVTLLPSHKCMLKYTTESKGKFNKTVASSGIMDIYLDTKSLLIQALRLNMLASKKCIE